MTRRGFTLIELMVTISIFVFMTALVLARYGSYDSGTLLTNTAYDIALTIRQAQTYGISVMTNGGTFNSPYGVVFTTLSGGSAPCGSNVAPQPQSFVFFADTQKTGRYSCQPTDIVNTYNLKQGAKISGVCGGDNCPPNDTSGTLSILFKRPDPSALIYYNGSLSTYAAIKVTSSDGTNSHIIIVRQNGQISVQ